MHKKIALIIKRIVEESPYEGVICEVIPPINDDGEIKGNGFWKCVLLLL